MWGTITKLGINPGQAPMGAGLKEAEPESHRKNIKTKG
jgi:hypothetical protein